MSEPSLSRRLVAEFLGTGALLVAVVGSGIMGDQLSGGNVAIALLANSLATGAALLVLIVVFGPISGAHFNPAVTLALCIGGAMRWRDLTSYIAVQIIGGITGVIATHLMFREPLIALSQHARTGGPQLLSEVVATFGLLAVIWGCARQHRLVTPVCVAAYITGAYWFTSSTSFANPAVTIARAFTDTFAGIRPEDAPAFIAAQVVGAVLATLVFRWLLRPEADAAAHT